MPHANVELVGREQLRAFGGRRDAMVEYFIQNTHPGVIRLNGDTASGRAYMSELIRLRDGSSHVNYAIYHDRYRRTPDGWRFAERVYEIRYLDTTPLAGSPPQTAAAAH
jgi:ketosteroid isomerase-like protein